HLESVFAKINVLCFIQKILRKSRTMIVLKSRDVTRAPARFAFLPAALRASQPSPVLRSCTAHSRTPVHPPAARPRNPRKSHVHGFFAHLCASGADAHLSHFSCLLDSPVPNPTSVSRALGALLYTLGALL
ncbi:Unknown protein, partial [Striga hermonthica]